MTVQAYEIEAALDRYARSAGVKPVQAYYIWGEFRVEQEGHVFYSDEAHEYCEACADTLLAQVLPLLPKVERDDHRVSPTNCHSEDTCKHCMTCGVLLDYALNDWGARNELTHYATELSTRDDLPPGEAFHIARIIEAAPNDEAVLAIARIALARIPKAAAEG
ncbi:hypothetical protein DFR49_0747 [Hephaestia caeni]|uniref:Uncharacterized protein n=1 Tax=Hephaestia caeni TaxID=645617 RepID=A0A397PJ89_9SPHN|nr:hypothetical protein [Hephaestia caeni]RIA46214.1 hypothetical protein DFR49_0747 [Hephaestia caeni]